MMDFIGGVASGVGALGGGVLDYFGQQEANKANQAIASGANQMSQDIAREQMAFQERMSNTAKQREIGDLKAAGLNPILAARGGASTPPGASGSVTTGAPQQNALRGLGEGLGKSLPTALSVVNLQKDLEQKDAGINATKAATLASVAQANNSNATAKATEAQMGSYVAKSRSAETEADAAIAEGGVRKRRAEIDKSAAVYDAVADRLIQAAGGVSSAVGIGALLNRMRNMNERTQQQGLKGTKLK